MIWSKGRGRLCAQIICAHWTPGLDSPQATLEQTPFCKHQKYQRETPEVPKGNTRSTRKATGEKLNTLHLYLAPTTPTSTKQQTKRSLSKSEAILIRPIAFWISVQNRYMLDVRREKHFFFKSGIPKTNSHLKSWRKKGWVSNALLGQH